MTGDEQPADKLPVGSPGNPPTPTKEGFYRGLDNKIYHDKPDIFIRLAQLKHQAKLGLTTLAIPLQTLFTLLAGVCCIYLTSGYSSMVTDPLLIFLTLVFLPLLLFGIAGFLIHKTTVAILTIRYQAHYNQTSWYLYHTDFAVLVANEQFGMRILEETKDMPILKWTGAPAPTSFEDYLWFSACYRNAMCQCHNGNPSTSSSTLPTGSFPLAALRHGSCLHFLGTQSAKSLAWVAMFLSCGFTAIITLPMLFTGAFRDAERRGSLAAICDFFIGTCDVDVNKLTPPQDSPSELEPSVNILHPFKYTVSPVENSKDVADSNDCELKE